MTTAPTCIARYENQILVAAAGTWEPCGPVNASNPITTCCLAGDTCLEDGMCSYSHEQVGGSGYYTSACTDSNFGSPCVERCTDQPVVHIQYQYSNAEWYCCGSDPDSGGALLPNCSNLTSESYGGIPAPPELATLIIGYPATTYTQTGTSSSSTSSRSSSASSPSTSSSTLSPSPTTALPTSSATTTLSASRESTGLSTGAKAGIGIGAALGALLLIALIIFAFMRRKRSRASRPETSQTSHTSGMYTFGDSEGRWQKGAANQEVDVHGDTAEMKVDLGYRDQRPGTSTSGVAELDANRVHELAAR